MCDIWKGAEWYPIGGVRRALELCAIGVARRDPKQIGEGMLVRCLSTAPSGAIKAGVQYVGGVLGVVKLIWCR